MGLSREAGSMYLQRELDARPPHSAQLISNTTNQIAIPNMIVREEGVLLKFAMQTLPEFVWV